MPLLGSRLVSRVVLGAGTAAVLAGLVVIWVSRLGIHRTVYVSELGAAGMPTAGPFSVALLLLAAGGLLIASRSAHLTSEPRWLAYWSPAATLAIASVSFVVTSQVPCSAGCPVPLVDPRATADDLLHVASAVLGFAAACFAMLQVAEVRGQRVVSIVSRLSAWSVASITVTGGLLSVFGTATGVGAWLEFAGMTVAVGWIAVFGSSLFIVGTPAPCAVVEAVVVVRPPAIVPGPPVVEASTAAPAGAVPHSAASAA